jgi:hypothetical protein
MSFVVNWDDEPLVQGRIHEAIATLLDHIIPKLGN